MKVAFGMKAHSGWAALVVLGERRGAPEIVERRRVELVEEEWAKAPYHAAEDLESGAARDTVKRGIAAAHRVALKELRAALERERERDNEVAACAVLVGNPLPQWSTEEILAVHFRMHHAEGVLFREALVRAAEACGVRTVPFPEKALARHALAARFAKLGKSVGPPWGRDQKDAALAAFVALKGQ